MAKPRDTYKYQFKVGNKVMHGGITNDLERRETEHQEKWPKGHIKQVGNKTTLNRLATRRLRNPPASGKKTKAISPSVRPVLRVRGRGRTRTSHHIPARNTKATDVPGLLKTQTEQYEGMTSS